MYRIIVKGPRPLAACCPHPLSTILQHQHLSQIKYIWSFIQDLFANKNMKLAAEVEMLTSYKYFEITKTIEFVRNIL